MAEHSLWITSIDESQSSKPILDYIVSQGEDLGKQTEGKIKGILIKAGASWASVAKALSTMFGSSAVYQPTHFKEHKDASELYKKTTYEFIIIDDIHKYELSIFQITCNDTLPIQLSIDPTIAKEENLDENSNISSYERFKDIFKSIATSDKVVYVINRLLSLPVSQSEAQNGSVPENSDINEEG